MSTSVYSMARWVRSSYFWSQYPIMHRNHRGMAKFYTTLTSKINYTSIKNAIVQELQCKDNSNWHLALSLGLGAFMSFAPVWGFQMAIAVSFAFAFRLNKALVLLAANISSIPPLVPLILYCSYQMGAFLLNGSFQNEIPEFTGILNMGENLLTYILGAIVSGGIFGILFTIVSYSTLLLFRSESKQS